MGLTYIFLGISNMKSTVADFIVDSVYEELPAEVISQAKRCLLDVLGNMIAGFSTMASTIARRFASSFTNPQQSTLFGNENRVPCVFAGFSNSIMASDLDADDGHRGAMGHPGAAIVPASLAVSEMYSLNGRKLLEAIAIGYEIGIRMGMVMNQAAENRFWGSGNWISFGAAAAVSKLLNLGKDECMNALGICEAHTPMAPMNWMFSGHYAMTKEAIGWGTFTAVSAAFLAKEGMIGNFTLVNSDASGIMNTLGKEWEINKIYFKSHSSCRYTHPAIDSILQLKKKFTFNETEISCINIGTFRFALGLNSTSPMSLQEAQYSIPFTVGAALAYGRVGPTEISKERLNDDRIITVAKKVHLYNEPDTDNHFPKQTMARVEVKLKDGRSLTMDPIPLRGDYQNPFTEEEMDEKFRCYASTLLVDEDIRGLISLGKKVEEIENTSRLTEKLNGAIINRLKALGNW